MSEASDFLTRLETVYRNVDIDWEALLESNYESLLKDIPDLGIIDIGGHTGRHTQVFRHRLKPTGLWVFEPLPEQRKFLETTFERQPGVAVFGVALGSHRAEATFVVKRGSPEESGLRQRSFYNDGSDGDLEHIPVQVEALDDLQVPFKVHFIKIDAEGGEIDILKGAGDTLRQHAPIVSVEFGRGGYDAYGHRPETLFELAAACDYSVFDLLGNRFGSIEEWKSCVDRFYWDYLLIPDNQITDMTHRITRIRTIAEQAFSPPWDFAKS